MLIRILHHETVLSDNQLSYQRQAGVSYFSFSVMLQNGIPNTDFYDTVPDLRRTGMKWLICYTLPKTELKKWRGGRGGREGRGHFCEVSGFKCCLK